MEVLSSVDGSTRRLLGLWALSPCLAGSIRSDELFKDSGISGSGYSSRGTMGLRGAG